MASAPPICRSDAVAPVVLVGPSPPIVLSVVGHSQRDPTGVYFVNTLITEQIAGLVPGATILHLVLDDNEKVHPTDHCTIGYITPAGHPMEEPKTSWINFYAQSFYPHLRDHRVTHILGHAPAFIWGAINIKKNFFPDAVMMMMVHEQINQADNGNGSHKLGEDFVKWSDNAEVLVSVGTQTFNDVELLLYTHDRFFEDEKKLCYFPKTPNRFADIGPWAKPPATKTPVIVILAGDLHTQRKQKMNLKVMMKALTAVAEQLNQSNYLKKILIKIVGVPRAQQHDVEQTWHNINNSYVRVEFHEAATYNLLELHLKSCCMCILPLGCSSDAYGLEMMIPVTFGVPMLLPNSASIISDARMVTVEDHICHMSLSNMVVDVMAAKQEEEEINVWRVKITEMLTNQDQAHSCATTLRKALINNDFIRKNGRKLINLLNVPSRRIQREQYEAALAEKERSDAGIAEIEVEKCVTVAVPAALPHQPYTDLKQENRKREPNAGPLPVPSTSLLIGNWVTLVDSLELFPLIDVMLAQSSINYVNYEELTELRGHPRAAIRQLLGIQRKKGELGIKQLVTALRMVGTEWIALLLDPPSTD